MKECMAVYIDGLTKYSFWYVFNRFDLIITKSIIKLVLHIHIRLIEVEIQHFSKIFYWAPANFICFRLATAIFTHFCPRSCLQTHPNDTFLSAASKYKWFVTLVQCDDGEFYGFPKVSLSKVPSHIYILFASQVSHKKCLIHT